MEPIYQSYQSSDLYSTVDYHNIFQNWSTIRQTKPIDSIMSSNNFVTVDFKPYRTQNQQLGSSTLENKWTTWSPFEVYNTIYIAAVAAGTSVGAARTVYQIRPEVCNSNNLHTEDIVKSKQFSKDAIRGCSWTTRLATALLTYPIGLACTKINTSDVF